MLVEALFNFRTLTGLILVISVYLFCSKRRPVFPTINKYPGDLFSWKSNHEYITNALELITRGIANYQGPITLAIPNGQKIILPSSLTGWVKSNRDLDHRELARQDFFAGFPGFEAQTALHSFDDTILDMIRTKLGQNIGTILVMNASLANALQIHWGDNKVWHTIDWQKDTTGIIARAASSVFIGLEKADDPEWLNVVQGYVNAYFSAVSELHQYPAWQRRFVHMFLPNAIACRKYVPQARDIVNGVIAKRREEAENAISKGETAPEYNDALAWTQGASNGKIQSGDIQLALAMAALLTTSELFRQALIDIASHPDLVEPLRNEISQQVSTHGVSVAATNNMVLMDSVLKESQRRSAPLVGLERVALKDLRLPNGETIPRGSHIMVDSTDLWDPLIYPNPDRFDAYRFLRKREAGDKFSQFVQSGPHYNVFGGGRHICPGRFFASNELKLALAHVLLKYDIRLADSYKSDSLQVGVYKVVDPQAQLMVRARSDSPRSVSSILE